jgi:hypothetical protein
MPATLYSVAADGRDLVAARVPWARGKGSFSTAVRRALSSLLIPGSETPAKGLAADLPAVLQPNIDPKRTAAAAIHEA